MSSRFLALVERTKDSAGVLVNTTLAAKALHELSKYDPAAVARLIKEAEDHLARIRRENKGQRIAPCLRRY